MRDLHAHPPNDTEARDMETHAQEDAPDVSQEVRVGEEDALATLEAPTDVESPDHDAYLPASTTPFLFASEPPDPSTPAWQGKRLSKRARHALRLVASGRTQTEAARETGLTQTHVSRLVNSDIGRKYLAEVEAAIDREFSRLMGQVVDVLREGLRSPDRKERLEAARIYLSARRHTGVKVSVGVSAEDVVKELMDKPKDEAVKALAQVEVEL